MEDVDSDGTELFRFSRESVMNLDDFFNDEAKMQRNRRDATRAEKAINEDIQRTSQLINSQAGVETVELKDFIIKRQLGRGTFGRVYLAELPAKNRLYAIKGIRKDKLIDTNQIQSTFNEMNVMLEAQHPNLCGMEYFFQTESRLYFVMPHIKGGDMYAHMRKYHKFDEIIVKFYITQIVLGIGQLHQRNIIHRDLKLENIMLCENGYIKLIDFGMSRVLAPGNDHATTYAGTAEYMAPEMLDRNSNYNFAIDWWAVGILMYELLTGVTPFFHQNRNQLNRNIMN